MRRFSDQKDHGNIKESERIWTRRTPHSAWRVNCVNSLLWSSYQGWIKWSCRSTSFEGQGFRILYYFVPEGRSQEGVGSIQQGDVRRRKETRRNFWHPQVHLVDVSHNVKSTIVQWCFNSFLGVCFRISFLDSAPHKAHLTRWDFLHRRAFEAVMGGTQESSHGHHLVQLNRRCTCGKVLESGRTLPSCCACRGSKNVRGT